jgi:hypothetical protein
MDTLMEQLKEQLKAKFRVWQPDAANFSRTMFEPGTKGNNDDLRIL